MDGMKEIMDSRKSLPLLPLGTPENPLLIWWPFLEIYCLIVFTFHDMFYIE